MTFCCFIPLSMDRLGNFHSKSWICPWKMGLKPVIPKKPSIDNLSDQNIIGFPIDSPKISYRFPIFPHISHKKAPKNTPTRTQKTSPGNSTMPNAAPDLPAARGKVPPWHPSRRAPGETPRWRTGRPRGLGPVVPP